ncbi:MATE family efflux transporter [Salidesulfovibrio onnuriiensis]|uniref:MATE family efflux transporter n=1 Tax=Salidesulfovibrio onnuriiensis TaxID=2583823 RepID=UPI0011CBCBC3|nr:MATE family efflux transporter [Salidesulfovibrio onnuriiensis]
MVQHNDLTRGPLPGLIRQIAVPTCVGMVFSTMYNVVDTWFAGLIGTEAQAALSLSFPVFFLLMAAGSGLQVGSTSLIGSALGEGDRDRAASYAVQAISFGLLASAGLAVLGLWASPHLFGFMGAKGPYLETCMAYMGPIFSCAPVFLLLYMCNATLQAVGDTRTFRNFIAGGAALNCALDPWFIYGGLGLPPMGVAGVAWATVVIHAAGCGYLLLRVRKTGLLKTDKGRNLVPRPGLYLSIARQGLPASVNFLTIAIGVFVINSFVSDFGQGAVAAYGIAMRVEQIALMPTIGLNVAALSIISQNFGARDFGRIRETLRLCLKYGAWMMLPAAAPIILLARPFMAAFSSDPAVVETGAAYLRIDALVLYGYVVIFVGTSALQAIQKPMFAIWLGLGRQFLAPVLLFWLFTRILGLGILSIWWSIFAIVWIAAGITYWFSRRKLREAAAGAD